MNDRLEPDPQEAVINFLADPMSYGLRNDKVERIESHCSFVFLVEDRAYKLKRAIRYASLDYTTVERRRRACDAEVELNRRTASDLYLGVRTINRRAASELEFDGPGLAVDHVVVMRRFDQSDLFDHLTDIDALTPALMQMLGARIAQFHAEAEIMPAYGGRDAIRRVVADNARELALVAATLDGAAVDALSTASLAALDRIGPLLDDRRSHGHVRRCHGDLRLANICLYQGRPTLFDCIEFSDEIGCIDVLYDLAFLLLDLHLRQRNDLGNIAFNAYLDQTHEAHGLQALPLFLSLRAATRSYALAGKACRAKEQQSELAALARRCIQVAHDVLLPRPPVVVMLGGEDHEGRSKAAALLAPFIGPPVGARICHLDASSEVAWREACAVLDAGHSVILEGAFTKIGEGSSMFAFPPAIASLHLWLGPLPGSLNRQVWQTIDGVNAAIDLIAHSRHGFRSTA
jgi:hypothetical protein